MEMTLEQKRALAMAQARLRLQEKPSVEEIEPEPQSQEADTADKIMGHPATRFATGAASPFIGLMQLGANVGSKLADVTGLTGKFGKTQYVPMSSVPEEKRQEIYEQDMKTRGENPMGLDVKAVNDYVKRLDEMKRRGMEARGDETDVAGIAGTVLNPLGLAAGKGLPAAKTVGEKIIQGAKLGAVYGGTQPVTSDDFFTSKAVQTGGGAAIGGTIPAVTGAVRATGRGLRDIADLVLPKGAERIVQRHWENIVGPSKQKVADALLKAKEIIPGSKPTAGQAVAGMPSGSPIIAQQKITAGTPGGISEKFGERALEQQAAREAAKVARRQVTQPMREAALSAANVKGIKPKPIMDSIDTLASQPGWRASEMVSKSLDAVKTRINEITKGGKIEANDLYTVRKEIGNVIAKQSKETANWDKKLAAKLQKKIQESIDDAIESSGGKGWKEYLAEYSKRSQAIKDDITRAKISQKPLQPTRLQSALNIGEGTESQLPRILSRPVVIANFLLKKLAGKESGIEPRIDKIMADQLLNPQKLGKVLEEVPPSKRQMVIESIMKNAYGPAVIGTPSVLTAQGGR